MQLEPARRHRHHAIDVALAQAGRLERVRRVRVEVREERLHRLGIPAREAQAVARQRRRVDVRGLDPTLGPRQHVRCLELETALVERDEERRPVGHHSTARKVGRACAGRGVNQGAISGADTMPSTTSRCAAS